MSDGSDNGETTVDPQTDPLPGESRKGLPRDAWEGQPAEREILPEPVHRSGPKDTQSLWTLDREYDATATTGRKADGCERWKPSERHATEGCQ